MGRTAGSGMSLRHATATEVISAVERSGGRHPSQAAHPSSVASDSKPPTVRRWLISNRIPSARSMAPAAPSG